MKPYFDISDQVRLFSQEIDERELMWHRDEEDREIVSILKTDWKIQLENRLPSDLNSPVKIKAGEWHRVIKGNGDLKIKIKRIL
jgi:hypothetical protein